jgi:hypothetical protein
MHEEKAKIIKANNKLQQKVGAGPLDLKTVIQSQHVIDNNTVDFVPLGLAILHKLEIAVAQARTGETSIKDMKQILTTPVMELKANATTFHYTLIGTLANIMLNFLETITVLDKDAIDIVNAHHDTLHMIIVRKMKGAGGEAGQILAKELQQACDRYYHKKFGK